MYVREWVERRRGKGEEGKRREDYFFIFFGLFVRIMYIGIPIQSSIGGEHE